VTECKRICQNNSVFSASESYFNFGVTNIRCIGITSTKSKP